MEVVVKNFRCYKEHTFTLGKGMILLSGSSGSGKSSLLEAIVFCLYGTVKNVKSLGVRSCSVTVRTEKFVATRTKGPCTFIVNYNNKKYEMEEAQAVIFNIFPKDECYWYIPQGSMNLLSLTPSALLERLTFSKNSESIKNKTDEYLKGCRLKKCEIEKRVEYLKGVVSKKPSVVKEPIKDDDIDTPLDELLLQEKKLTESIEKVNESIKKLKQQKESRKLHKKRQELEPIANSELKDKSVVLQKIKQLEINKRIKQIQKELDSLIFTRKDVEEAKKAEHIEEVLQSTLSKNLQIINTQDLEKELALAKEASANKNPLSCPKCEAHLVLIDGFLSFKSQKSFLCRDEDVVLKELNEAKRKNALANERLLEIEKLKQKLSTLQYKGKSDKLLQKVCEKEKLIKELSTLTFSKVKENNLEEELFEIEQFNIKVKKAREELKKIPNVIYECDVTKEECISKLSELTSTLNNVRLRISKLKEFNLLKKEYDAYIDKDKEWQKNNLLLEKQKARAARYDNRVITAERVKELIKSATHLVLTSRVNKINKSLNKSIGLFFDNVQVKLELTRKTVREKFEVNFKILVNGEIVKASFLSGGEKQRINLCIAIALCDVFQSEFLFLDECVNNLDAETNFKVLSLLKEVSRGSFANTIVVVSHECVKGVFDEVVKF